MPSFVDLLLKTRRWYLRNDDSGETLEGQFPARQTTREVKNNYAKHTSLNRGRSIVQYLNSENENLVFQGQLHAYSALNTNTVQEQLNLLIKWAKRDPELARPPIVTFWIGDGHLEQRSVIESISGITYGEPTILGAIRDVTFTLNLLQYSEFTLDDKEATDTRYHRARERDYYELLTQREYKNPLLGDVIRKRHPTQPSLFPGAVVKLPSIAGIRTERVEPKSIPLSTAFGRIDTPQRALRQRMFDARNRPYTSHILAG